jgi:hypothetical protein
MLSSSGVKQEPWRLPPECPCQLPCTHSFLLPGLPHAPPFYLFMYTDVHHVMLYRQPILVAVYRWRGRLSHSLTTSDWVWRQQQRTPLPCCCSLGARPAKQLGHDPRGSATGWQQRQLAGLVMMVCAAELTQRCVHWLCPQQLLLPMTAATAAAAAAAATTTAAAACLPRQ